MAKESLEVIWSPEALADKLEILDYWYRRIGTKTYSKKLNQQFNEIASFLSEYPNAGRVHSIAKMQYFIKNHYCIFYKTKGTELHIMQIWDGRRNDEDLNK